jgi:hypothetical protein
MAFDPDKYLKKKGGFDPDAYLKKSSAAPEVKARSSEVPTGVLGGLRAGVEGITEGFTGGYTANLVGAERAALNNTDYVSERDKYLALQKQLKEENPYSYGGGRLVGTLANPIFRAVNAVLPGGTALKNIGAAGAAGLATGLVENPGDVQGKISGAQIPERLIGGAAGAGTGLVAGGAFEGAKGLLRAYGGKAAAATKLAGRQALSALGFKTPELRAIYKGSKDIDKVGSFALNEKIVAPGRSVEEAQKVAEQVANKYGQQIGQTYKAVQDTINNPAFLNSLDEKEAAKLAQAEINPSKLADDMVNYVATKNKNATNKDQLVQMAENYSSILKRMGDKTKIPDLLEYRKSLDDLIYNDMGVMGTSRGAETMSELRRMTKVAIDKQIAAISSVAKNKKGFENLSEMVGGLKSANDNFGYAATIRSLAKKSMARENAKLPIGPMEIGGAIAAGAATGNPLMAGAGLAATKLGREYGPGFASAGLRGAGQLMSRDPLAPLATKAAGQLNRIPPGLIGIEAERRRRELR